MSQLSEVEHFATIPVDAADPVADFGITPLSHSSVVERERVHRVAVSEVFLTDFQTLSGRRAAAAAQWPRGHRVYRPHDGRPDTLLVAETVRQAGILAAGAVLDVPGPHRIVMDRLTVELDLDQRLGDGAADILLEVALTETQRRTPSCTTYRIEIEFVHRGARIARGTGAARALEPRVYRRVRGEIDQRVPDPVEAVPAGLVGMGFSDDVAIGRELPPDRDGTRRWPVRVLPEHPIMFDHPLDHVPGMLIAEAFRQVTRLVTGWSEAALTEVDLRTSRFVELGAAAEVELVQLDGLGAGEVALALAVRQGGEHRATVSTVAVPGPRDG